jgi:hypothetical protein
MMTVAVSQLSESMQTLIDSRLDTIDRMLMGRVPRQDRLAIVREVEAQVFELLQERGEEELSRDDVLAVLARLDPPEAYLPEEMGGEPIPARIRSRPQVNQPVRRGDTKVAKVSGIVGLSMVVLFLLMPVYYVVAVALSSEAVLLILGGGTLALIVIGGILAVVLGIYSRMASAWSVVGLVTGVLSLLGCLVLMAVVGLLV